MNPDRRRLQVKMSHEEWALLEALAKRKAMHRSDVLLEGLKLVWEAEERREYEAWASSPEHRT